MNPIKISAADIEYRAMTEGDFAKIIALGNSVHGDGYLDTENIAQWHQRGLKDELNASFVAYYKERLIGFRISFAPGKFNLDKWYSPQLWKTTVDQTAYFKCNTVDADYRGLGIGSKLLTLAKEVLIKQGAQAGVSHLWRQSPGNSAVGYFTKCGGELIKDHPDKWYADSVAGYECTLCARDCHCVAAEMIIYF